MKKVMKKAAMGTAIGPKAKVKTMDRGQYAPNVDVKRKPTTREVIESKMGPLSKPFASDSTSKMKKGGKVAKKKK
jgi:hypothetical protein